MIDDILYIGLFFGIAVILKRIFPIFQRFVIPNSIIAGFIGFLLGPNVLNLTHLDFNTLGKMVYHMMAIGFISLALRDMTKNKTVDAFNSGFIIVTTYLFQGFVGFLMMLIWGIFDPRVSPLIGIILPLGFGQGPGQAYSIGSQWERLGLVHGSSVGLAIAAAGFGWATFGGIVILNFLIKKTKYNANGSSKDFLVKKKIMEVKDYEFSDMDGMTIQIAIISIIYIITFLFLKFVEISIGSLGNLGRTVSTVLWGFHFVFGAIIAMLFRRIYGKLQRKGIAKENYLNNFLLQRIGGGVFDFMVAASISAVSFEKIKGIFWPIFFLTMLGGILTYLYISFIVSKTIQNYKVENKIAFYGMLTGTISTGMALLRELDPGFEKGVAENLVFGSGFSIFIGFPLIFVLNIPAMYLTTQNNFYYILTFLGMLGYALFAYLIWYRKKPRNST